MTTWKLILEYDGTRYSGWQEQRNARTIAGEVRRAAEEYLDAEVELGGSGRTDAGVHAAAQVAHLRADIRKPAPAARLLEEMNRRLPADIVVLEAQRVSNQFHARHDAIRRSYIYQISTRKSAFSKRYVWWIKEKLDIDAMQRAATMLPGRHDFACFAAADPSRSGESTVVVVEAASLEVEGDLVLFRIEASHFLWRMVRRLVGMLVKSGLHEVTEADWGELLAARCHSKRLEVAAWTAPAAGLFLDGVKYPD